ncbi:DDRGK domain-containing protein 1-like [Mugil cephalus]|uniref:DDRGK domain-containing protein 1-like n=1 Tax=Mugil cephalus TaxID=48193 RepID=UPI001FB7704D|nr:DDRGK domain-containing protein 1-like [Mugil cephalus]
MQFLRRKEWEEEERRRQEEERRRQEEEARRQEERLFREEEVLGSFRRGLLVEAGGLQKSQGVSRPWISSYFLFLGQNQSERSACDL